jgi:hypothetical protein
MNLQKNLPLAAMWICPRYDNHPAASHQQDQQINHPHAHTS